MVATMLMNVYGRSLGAGGKLKEFAIFNFLFSIVCDVSKTIRSSLGYSRNFGVRELAPAQKKEACFQERSECSAASCLIKAGASSRTPELRALTCIILVPATELAFSCVHRFL
jgi:hypothetical protein